MKLIRGSSRLFLSSATTVVLLYLERRNRLQTCYSGSKGGIWGRTRMMTSLAGTAILAIAMSGLIVTLAEADDNVRSSPPDTTHYSRPLIPEDLNPLNTGNPLSPSARH